MVGKWVLQPRSVLLLGKYHISSLPLLLLVPISKHIKDRLGSVISFWEINVEFRMKFGGANILWATNSSNQLYWKRASPVADKDIQDQDTWSNGQRNYWQWRTVLLVLSSVFLKPSPHHSWHPFLGDHQAPIWVHFPVAGQQWRIKLPKLSSAFLSFELSGFNSLVQGFKLMAFTMW